MSGCWSAGSRTIPTTYSQRERVAHVVRRLGIGAHPALAAELPDVAAATSAMLDFSPPQLPPDVKAPRDWDSIDYDLVWQRLVPWWMERIASGRQPLAERLVWFWQDLLAVSGEKVDNPYILWQYHDTVRRHALGSFADLLHAVSTSAAMLQYLDGQQNAIDAPNENFAREVMELHTIGLGEYTQADVAELARATSGWVVNYPHPEKKGRFEYRDAPPWSGVFLPDRHDAGYKSFLGTTDRYDLPGAIERLLEHPSTGRAVAAKLYHELVGLEADAATAERLGTRFARDYGVRGLVEDITDDPAFLSDAAVRSRIRSPLEKAATVMQAFPLRDDFDATSLFWMFDKLNYLPLHPPNPAGFPKGVDLLDPARIMGSFELLSMVDDPEERGDAPADPLAALGLFDVSEQTRELVGRFTRPGLALGLAFGSPEFQLV